MQYNNWKRYKGRYGVKDSTPTETNKNYLTTKSQKAPTTASVFTRIITYPNLATPVTPFMSSLACLFHVFAIIEHVLLTFKNTNIKLLLEDITSQVLTNRKHPRLKLLAMSSH